jgi:hypothetical protein
VSNDRSKDELKVTALLKEYGHVRQEVRTFEVLQIMCIFLSVIIFVIMFIGGIFSGRFIFFFISPAISIFFMIIAMGMMAYINNLGIRSSQISGQLKKILEETTIDWENTVGIFGSIRETLFTKKIAKYWWQIAIIAIGLGIAPTISVMVYGFEQYVDEVGIIIAYLTLILYASTIIVGFIVFYRLETWQRIKFNKDLVDL